MSRVRYFIATIATLLGLLSWASGSAQASTKEDELVKLTKTILQKAAEKGRSEFQVYFAVDPEPDEDLAAWSRRRTTVMNWAAGIFTMEQMVRKDPELLKDVTYKKFIVTRECDEKGKPLPITKVRFEVPESAREKVFPPGTKVFEWRLIFGQSNIPKEKRAKEEPPHLLIRIDQITPAPPGPF